MRQLIHGAIAAKYAESLLVVGLLALLLLQVWSSSTRINMLADEGTHLASGYSYWISRDFRLNQEHPPLVKLVGALPLLIKGLATQQSWPIFLSAPDWDAIAPNQWLFAETLLHMENRPQFRGNLEAARRAVSIFVLIMALCIYFMSRRLFGVAGGMISLLVVVFNPDILAHAGLITTDMAMATFYFGTTVALWWYFQRPSIWKLMAVGLMLGLGLACKYSNLLLLPLLVTMVAVICGFKLAGNDQPSNRHNPFGAGSPGQRFYHVCLAIVIVLATSAIVLWSGYLFTDPFVQYWKSYRLLYSNISEGYQYFLLEHYAPRFWNYFLVTIALKTPLSLWVLSVPALAAYWLCWRKSLSVMTKLVLIMPPLLLLVVMSMKAMNMGHRYVLGIYPYGFVLVGMTSYWLKKPLKKSAAGVALLVVFALAVYVYGGLRAYPFYISYSNALVASDHDFIECLDDSNTDWGQGWLEVARIQKEEQLYPLYVTPYGMGEYFLGGASGKWQMVNPFSETPPSPGYYAMSSNLYIRNRDTSRLSGIKIPLLEDYRPWRIIAGGIVLIEVPPPGQKGGKVKVIHSNRFKYADLKEKGRYIWRLMPPSKKV
ncbi:MAG: glycosyltransferase family 39 protein [Proteobacteria bacterium]|nr:glycosyltransferase family 39 protein [Pseudomonadota bacterium]MBU1715998.1 glycosyltransferase family 39 protein [Pseudomonadota bacterium]